MRIQKISVSDHNSLRVLQLTVYGCIILYFGRTIFIPLSFALLISFVLYPICAWMEKRGIGRLSAIMISVMLIIVPGFALLGLLIKQFAGFIQEWPSLYVRLVGALEKVRQFMMDAFGISVERQNDWLSKISDQSVGTILEFLRNTIVTSTFSAVLLVLVPVYVVLILYYRNFWMDIVYRIFPSEKKDSLREIIGLTIKAYYNFIKGMGLVYLIVGILNSVGLLILGVPHAILFGFVASILTFIPYIGIIVGSLLPITVAWITYDSVWYPVGIIGIFAFVQYLEANIIFPLAVSYRLNVNTLVMLLAIFTGGLLWGVAGMILFVPFAGIAKLIADHNPKWKTVSMILGNSRR